MKRNPICIQEEACCHPEWRCWTTCYHLRKPEEGSRCSCEITRKTGSKYFQENISSGLWL